MSQFLLVAAVALTIGGIVFGITVLLTGDERGLRPVQPDGRAVPLPEHRPLAETDVSQVRFDPALRGYRMAQVDAAMRRAAYDIGYKDELIRVLQAEVDALRAGRSAEAEALRRSREEALAVVTAIAAGSPPAPDAEPSPETEPAPSAEPAESESEPAEPAAASAESESDGAAAESAESESDGADTGRRSGVGGTGQR